MPKTKGVLKQIRGFLGSAKKGLLSYGGSRKKGTKSTRPRRRRR